MAGPRALDLSSMIMNAETFFLKGFRVWTLALAQGRQGSTGIGFGVQGLQKCPDCDLAASVPRA